MFLLTSILSLAAIATNPVYGQADSTPTTSIDVELFHSKLKSSNDDLISRGIFSVNLISDGKKGSLDPLKNGIFDQSSLDAFKRLLDTNSLYQIKISKEGINGTTHSIISSIPAVR